MSFTCEVCLNVLSTKYNLKRHQSSNLCKLDDKISKNIIGKINIDGDTNSINNNIDNSITLNINFPSVPLIIGGKEMFDRCHDELKLSYITEGQKRLGKFTVESILTDQKTGNKMVYCSDYQRKHMKWIDENGEEVDDYGGAKMFDIIIPFMKKLCEKKTGKILGELTARCMEEEDVEEKITLTKKLFKLRSDIRNFGDRYTNEIVKRTYRKDVRN